ncbi:polyketide synthase [Rhizobium paknamense]|uniref:Polyketide-type polyunsaturated fatty acid synthase PfaA n=1 Tax=Rhizobium paknamense TaxID=1206817 RepID=A0ABU0IDT5_9HYPH|nr:polyketide synthase [Rhizobium paknamense]MDQ0456409.1 polyketide-type polyunsaturated fatty acid synthase PfaA [Rhizobium paknamense]
MDGFSQQKNSGFASIAIVGVGALFPEARTADEFWQNIVTARDCLKDVPETHWKISDYYDPNPAAPDKTYARRGGFVPEIPFNPLEFGLPPTQLDVTDILQILSLTVAKQTFLDAGYDHAKLNREKTGCVLGITGANSLVTPLTSRLQYPVWKKVLASRGLDEKQVDDIIETLKLAYAPWEENSFPGMLGNVVAGRIANRFDLGGINCTVDAACASSLAAMRMAIDELHSGRADMMLTGGCDAENTILMYMCFSKTPAFSKKGVISPFDEKADGTLIGEGIGMMMLKRLEDAERDGDQIYAVIKGLGSSSDGKFKSIYAPRAAGQIKALERAYKQAGISPYDVDLLEAHGTGTAVGDATEVDGLKNFFKNWQPEGQPSPIGLGSVKSQIGHTKAAAGAASAIKVTLALQNGVLPPSINVNKPDPKLGLEETPLYINTVSRPWFRDPKKGKRRAGVSAFGFGGTNFHLVLEEAPKNARQPRYRGVLPRPVLISAPDVAALRKRLQELKGLTGEPAWPYETEIPPHHPRLGFAAKTEEARQELIGQALQMLESRAAETAWRHPKGIVFRASALKDGKVAGLFAGQGSQHPDMGRAAALAMPELHGFVTTADGLFLQSGDQRLSHVMYPLPAYDPEEKKAQERSLRRTQYAQTAIGALSAGHFRWFEKRGLKLDAAAGHSFGELSALWAANVLSDQDFMTLAKARGDAMATFTSDGASTMTAVKSGRAALESLVAESNPAVHFCNLNTPAQTVIGGSLEAVEAFEGKLKAANIAFTRLNVAGAFHTPFVAGAVEAFAGAIDKVAFNAPQIPVYANKDGKAYPGDAAAVAAQLRTQLKEPVEFLKIIEEMYTNGVRIFVEFGPRSTLSKMVADILGDRPHLAIALDQGQPDKSDQTLMDALVELAVAGLKLENPVTMPALGVQTPQKGEVMLNGINYVAPARKQAFQKALDNPVVVAAKPAPVAQPARPRAAAAAAAVEKISSPAPVASPAVKPPVAVAPPAPVAVAQPAAVPVAKAAVVEKPLTLTGETMSSNAHRQASANLVTGADFIADLAKTNGELHREYLKFEQAALSALLHNPGELGDAHIAALADIHGETNDTHREFMRSLVSLCTGPVVSGYKTVDAVAEPRRIPSLPQPAPQQPAASVAKAVTQPVEAPKAPVAAPAPVAPTPVAAPVAAVAKPQPAPVAVAAPAPAASVPAKAGPSAAAVKDVLLAVVSEKTGYPAEVIDLGMDLEADLGIDSIKRVEILGSLKERLPQMQDLSPEKLGELRTLAQIVELAGETAAAAPAAAPQAAPVTSAPVASGPSLDTVREALLAVVSEKTGYPAEVIDLGMDLEADLGIDSIKRVEILGSLKERLPQMQELAPEKLGELRTLAQILDVAGASAVAAAPVAAPAAVAAAPAKAGPSIDAVRDALLAVVSEKTGYPADVIDLGMDLEADLGIDSIKRVEILGSLKERLPQMQELAPEKLGELRTLAQILELASAGQPAVAAAPVAVAAPVSDGPSLDTVRTALLEVVSEKTGYPADVIDLGMDLEADLGIDSIKRVEILGSLKERLPQMQELAPEKLGELRTLAQILELAGGSQAAAAPAVIAQPVVSAPIAAVAPQSGISTAAARTALLEVVSEKTGYPADVIDLGMDLEADLGIDSIKRVEILGSLKERLPDMPELAPEKLGELRTLGQILDMVAQSGSAGGEAQPVTAPAAADLDDGVDLIGRGVVTLSPERLDLTVETPFRSGARIAIAGADAGVVAALQHQLTEKGLTPVWLDFDGTASGEGVVKASDDEAALKQLWNEGVSFDGVIYVHPTAIDNSLPGSTADASVIWLKRALLLAKLSIATLPQRSKEGRTLFVTLTRLDGALGYQDLDAAKVAAGALSGLVKTYAAEAPHVFARAVDIAPVLDDATVASLFVQELFDANHQITEIGLSADQRLKPGIVEESSLGAELVGDPNELFIVTGGARGVTADCVQALAASAPRRFLLIGRSSLEAEPAWAQGICDEAGLKTAALTALRQAGAAVTPKAIDQAVRQVQASREITDLLAALQKAGSQASYLSLDISSPAVVTLADHEEIRKAGKISLVHGAGALADQMIAQKKIADMDKVFTPKIFGLAGLLKGLAGKSLNRVVLFSSVAGLFGNPGQCDYAMANEILNRLAASGASKGQDMRAINWGPWLGGMVTPEIRQIFLKRGVPIIPRDLGGQYFAKETGMTLPATGAILVGGLKPINARFVKAAELALAERKLSINGAHWGQSVLLEAHRIKGRPVVPAAFVLGLVAEGLENLLPGWTVAGFGQFSVLNGLVINKDWSGEFELRVSALKPVGDKSLSVDVLLCDRSGRPRYKGESIALRPAAEEVGLVTRSLASLEGADSAASFYKDGTLFHGPELQLLDSVKQLGEGHILFGVRQPDASLSAALNGFADSRLVDAVAIDVVLQAALASTRLTADSASLPMRLGAASFAARPAFGSNWIIEARLQQARAQELDWQLTGFDLGGVQQFQLIATTVKREQTGSTTGKQQEAAE